MERKENEIAVVVCSFTIDPLFIKEQLVNFGRRFGVEMRGIIVTNGPQGSDMDDPRWCVLRGTNEDLDFSAFIQGASYWLNINDRIPQSFLFVNDSLFTSHSVSANLKATFRQLPLLREIQLPVLVGKTDRYFAVCHSNPWSDQSFYVSTYCFALNYAGLATLLHLPKWADADGLGHDIDISCSDWGSGLKPAFKEFLRANILYLNSPYAWQSLRKHIGNDFLLRRKARGIYFEHRLSGQFAKEGCILPTNAGPRSYILLYFWEIISRLNRRLFGNP